MDMTNKYTKIRISKNVNQEIKEQIEGTEYSMRQFVDEAVEEKLERERQDYNLEDRVQEHDEDIKEMRKMLEQAL